MWKVCKSIDLFHGRKKDEISKWEKCAMKNDYYIYNCGINNDCVNNRCNTIIVQKNRFFNYIRLVGIVKSDDISLQLK